uniref:Uncharacterized protein n=1 Tax=Cacopsylla melanoneura TaxID=428564 RepID=A0A8D8TZT8_9HEMI
MIWGEGLMYISASVNKFILFILYSAFVTLQNWLTRKIFFRDVFGNCVRVIFIRLCQTFFVSMTEIPVNVHIVGAVGSPPQFDIGDEGPVFLEVLDQFFTANRITDDRKVSILLTSVSNSVYKVLRSLCDPELPSSKTYDSLCTILKNQLTPNVPIFWSERSIPTLPVLL